MYSWCSWTTPCKGLASPGRYPGDYGKKGSSFLLEFGFRPHSGEGLSWLWCRFGSLARCLYGCDTWALCASSLVFGYNDLHAHACGWNMFYLTFWTARGFFVCLFVFPQSGLFKGIFEYILLYHFTWSLGSILTFDCRDWWGFLHSTSVGVHSCVDECARPVWEETGL